MVASTILKENGKLMVESDVKEMWMDDRESQNDVDKIFARERL